MATDFFEHQAIAHRNTGRLVALFFLAVVGIVGTTFIVAAGAMLAAEGGINQRSLEAAAREPLFWQVSAGAALAALVLILLGSLVKIAELRAGGGTSVAERLGGRRIYPNTTDPVERRLLNVVEEMALASGVPVPPVFLLTEEHGINAFAAGFSPSDAVVACTRGCAQQLSRDQLQGVIAHEFSHVLNGDMRLNIHLIGVLNGILLLGLVGRELLYVAGRGSRRSKRDGTIYLLVIGLAVLILGAIGSLMGNIIKAAVSRQREFLADASAVQFTRNPLGIAGALKRIGAAMFGSKLVSRHAAEASHMYFAEGLRSGFATLMATHPPLDERIRRLDPEWDGKYPASLPSDMAADALEGATAGLVGAEGPRPARPVAAQSVQQGASLVGNPTAAHRRHAQQLVAALPPPVAEAVREPYGARAVVYALVVDRRPEIRAAQLRALRQQAQPDVYALTEKLLPEMDGLDVRARLPLMSMALPALRTMSRSQYEVFVASFQNLVEADRRVDLFEWVLEQMLLRHLRPQFEPVKPPRVYYYGLQRLAQPCSVLLSVLAYAGAKGDGAQAAFDSAARLLPETPVKLLPPDQCGLAQLDKALRQLAQVVPKQRARIIDACAASICADAEVRVEEAEILRAICDMLDSPMPPLLPGESLAPADVAATGEPGPA
jgi:Zn-dependent protease with chaperone function